MAEPHKDERIVNTPHGTVSYTHATEFDDDGNVVSETDTDFMLDGVVVTEAEGRELLP